MVSGESLRLQKYLSMCGVCSRRKAEEAIARGDVTVDGEVAKAGQSVTVGRSAVSFCGEDVVPPRKKSPIVLALNKPSGYVCTHGDPHHRSSENIYALLPMYRQMKLICCGRLDKESEGLVIVTDSGAIAAKLMHPSKMVEKFYAVTLDKPLAPKHRKQLEGGIVDGGELLKIHAMKVLSGCRRLIIVLHCGKNRHIRRMMESVGYEVKKLIRYRIGNFSLGDIQPGKHRKLNEILIEQLCCGTVGCEL
ncbi:MAG: rRNA pseudouridine synthase [Puniceicoccales bacterium]|jgi:23S rRNA pseudouridine2605 synthase|nr:rRNA pseudouridine synthase [Puniceicoccales bacterium]